MLKNVVLDAKIHENFAKIWRDFDEILTFGPQMPPLSLYMIALKVWSTWHDPRLSYVMAQQLSGNLGVLIAEYLVVGATYVIMGYNIQSNYWMPVFLEARTGRRVYGVRYMEWTIDACGPELNGSIGEGPNHSNHSNHSNSFKIQEFFFRKSKN